MTGRTARKEICITRKACRRRRSARMIGRAPRLATGKRFRAQEEFAARFAARTFFFAEELICALWHDSRNRPCCTSAGDLLESDRERASRRFRLHIGELWDADHLPVNLWRLRELAPG